MSGKMLALGLGNILLSDEGVGVHIINALKERNCHPDIELVDGGVGGFSLINILEGYKKVVLIDAADASFDPGTVIRLSPEDLAETSGDRYSLHDIGLKDMIDLLRIRETLPEMMILGIVPADITSYHLGLSKDLNAKFEVILQQVSREIEKYFLTDELSAGSDP